MTPTETPPKVLRPPWWRDWRPWGTPRERAWHLGCLSVILWWQAAKCFAGALWYSIRIGLEMDAELLRPRPFLAFIACWLLSALFAALAAAAWANRKDRTSNDG